MSLNCFNKQFAKELVTKLQHSEIITNMHVELSGCLLKKKGFGLMFIETLSEDRFGYVWINSIAEPDLFDKRMFDLIISRCECFCG